MVELYYTSIEEIKIDNDFISGLDFVTPEKREKIKRFHFQEDAKRALLADLLIRYFATKKLNRNNCDLQFCTNQYGKPSLMDAPDFHYNLSHSGQFILCGISSNSIGVDIEQIKEGNISIAKNCFNAQEYNAILSAKEEQQNELFYVYWTLKESYIKYIGKGLSIPLKSFCFENKNSQYELTDNPENINFINCKFQEYYQLSVAFKSNSPLSSINFITMKSLLSMK